MTHCGSLRDLFNLKHPGEGNDNINLYAERGETMQNRCAGSQWPSLYGGVLESLLKGADRR